MHAATRAFDPSLHPDRSPTPLDLLFVCSIEAGGSSRRPPISCSCRSIEAGGSSRRPRSSAPASPGLPQAPPISCSRRSIEAWGSSPAGPDLLSISSPVGPGPCGSSAADCQLPLDRLPAAPRSRPVPDWKLSRRILLISDLC